MKKLFFNAYRIFLIGISLPIILSGFFNKRTGQEYGITFFSKIRLLLQMVRNNFKIKTASRFVEHILMAEAIFRVPKSVEGAVVEAGVFKGGSAANLSLACVMCSRELLLFDSFQGLPEPDLKDKKHIILSNKETHAYQKGAWTGTLSEVKKNISNFGNINVCKFYEGFFDQTLPLFKDDVILVFSDADLKKSTETCLKYLWPLLNDNGLFFIHEAAHNDLVSLFFDKLWWRDNLNSEVPCLIGAGNGLGLYPSDGGYKSSLAYTIKNPDVSKFKEMPPEV